MNNFTELGKEHEDDFNSNRKDFVKQSIWTTLGTFKYVGSIFDVYVPKFIRFLVGLSGGDLEAKNHAEDDSMTGSRGMILGRGVESSDAKPDVDGPANDEI